MRKLRVDRDLLDAIKEESVDYGELKRPEDILTLAQLQVWEDPSPVVCLLCGRRAGKTMFACIWLLWQAYLHNDSLLVYLALTKSSARNIVWPAMRDAVRLLGFSPDIMHEHTLTIALPNGSKIVCAGTDDVRTIEGWRGTKLRGCVVDEMGSQPNSWLRYVVEDILEPALLDLMGRMLLCGTPGLVPVEGQYWYDLTGPERRNTYPVYHFTIFDNPHIPHAATALEDLKRRRGWTDETPTYRREYLAIWVADVGALVFPLDETNLADILPLWSAEGAPLDPWMWRFAIGVDIGYVDATAITVVAAHPWDHREFVVRCEAHRKWLPRQVADRIPEIFEWIAAFRKQKSTPVPVIVDTGGMGKAYAEEMTRIYHIAVTPARKTEKESWVRLVRDKVLARSLVLLREDTKPLQEEWAALGWDENKRLPNPSHSDHVSDATIYALRWLFHYVTRSLKPTARPSADGARAYIERELDRLEADKRFRKAKSKRGYVRARC